MSFYLICYRCQEHKDLTPMPTMYGSEILIGWARVPGVEGPVCMDCAEHLSSLRDSHLTAAKDEARADVEACREAAKTNLRTIN